jgi:hypothetical protein
VLSTPAMIVNEEIDARVRRLRASIRALTGASPAGAGQRRRPGGRRAMRTDSVGSRPAAAQRSPCRRGPRARRRPAPDRPRSRVPRAGVCVAGTFQSVLPAGRPACVRVPGRRDARSPAPSWLGARRPRGPAGGKIALRSQLGSDGRWSISSSRTARCSRRSTPRSCSCSWRSA